MLHSHWLSARVLCIPLLAAVSTQNALSIWAQSPDMTSPVQLIPRTKAEREQRYQARHLITLIVQATDSSGKPVTGLKADDFVLLDNQKPTRAASFREIEGLAGTAKVHVMLVLRCDQRRRIVDWAA